MWRGIQRTDWCLPLIDRFVDGVRQTTINVVTTLKGRIGTKVLFSWEPRRGPPVLEQQPYEHNSGQRGQRVPVYS
jgi:hypothetical protein